MLGEYAGIFFDIKEYLAAKGVSNKKNRPPEILGPVF
tara:strand:+ start:730 stop:840 length:111 start_codon:yes stop_codon:yes gene_type:complete